MSVKLADLIDRHGVDVLEHLDRQVSVPTLDGLQFQGDVAVIPTRELGIGAGAVVPTAGIPVVRGENGGNTHLLLAQGDVRFAAAEQAPQSLRLGVLTVQAGATAFLAHPEHGYCGIAAGTYEIRRQREQADEIRIVAD